MTEDRKKPGLAFWATVALVVVLVAYPLSWGPACWIASWTARDDSDDGIVRTAEVVATIYRPALTFIIYFFEDRYPPMKAIYEYGAWGTRSGHPVSGVALVLIVDR